MVLNRRNDDVGERRLRRERQSQRDARRQSREEEAPPSRPGAFGEPAGPARPQRDASPERERPERQPPADPAAQRPPAGEPRAREEEAPPVETELALPEKEKPEGSVLGQRIDTELQSDERQENEEERRETIKTFFDQEQERQAHHDLSRVAATDIVSNIRHLSRIDGQGDGRILPESMRRFQAGDKHVAAQEYMADPDERSWWNPVRITEHAWRSLGHIWRHAQSVFIDHADKVGVNEDWLREYARNYNVSQYRHYQATHGNRTRWQDPIVATVDSMGSMYTLQLISSAGGYIGGAVAALLAGGKWVGKGAASPDPFTTIAGVGVGSAKAAGAWKAGYAGGQFYTMYSMMSGNFKSQAFEYDVIDRGTRIKWGSMYGFAAGSVESIDHWLRFGIPGMGGKEAQGFIHKLLRNYQTQGVAKSFAMHGGTELVQEFVENLLQPIFMSQALLESFRKQGYEGEELYNIAREHAPEIFHGDEGEFWWEHSKRAFEGAFFAGLSSAIMGGARAHFNNHGLDKRIGKDRRREVNELARQGDEEGAFQVLMQAEGEAEQLLGQIGRETLSNIDREVMRRVRDQGRNEMEVIGDISEEIRDNVENLTRFVPEQGRKLKMFDSERDYDPFHAHLVVRGHSNKVNGYVQYDTTVNAAIADIMDGMLKHESYTDAHQAELDLTSIITGIIKSGPAETLNQGLFRDMATVEAYDSESMALDAISMSQDQRQEIAIQETGDYMLGVAEQFRNLNFDREKYKRMLFLDIMQTMNDEHLESFVVNQNKFAQREEQRQREEALQPESILETGGFDLKQVTGARGTEHAKEKPEISEIHAAIQQRLEAYSALPADMTPAEILDMVNDPMLREAANLDGHGKNTAAEWRFIMRNDSEWDEVAGRISAYRFLDELLQLSTEADKAQLMDSLARDDVDAMVKRVRNIIVSRTHGRFELSKDFDEGLANAVRLFVKFPEIKRRGEGEVVRGRDVESRPAAEGEAPALSDEQRADMTGEQVAEHEAAQDSARQRQERLDLDPDTQQPDDYSGRTEMTEDGRAGVQVSEDRGAMQGFDVRSLETIVNETPVSSLDYLGNILNIIRERYVKSDVAGYQRELMRDYERIPLKYQKRMLTPFLERIRAQLPSDQQSRLDSVYEASTGHDVIRLLKEFGQDEQMPITAEDVQHLIEMGAYSARLYKNSLALHFQSEFHVDNKQTRAALRKRHQIQNRWAQKRARIVRDTEPGPEQTQMLDEAMRGQQAEQEQFEFIHEFDEANLNELLDQRMDELSNIIKKTSTEGTIADQVESVRHAIAKNYLNRYLNRSIRNAEDETVRMRAIQDHMRNELRNQIMPSVYNMYAKQVFNFWEAVEEGKTDVGYAEAQKFFQWLHQKNIVGGRIMRTNFDTLLEEYIATYRPPERLARTEQELGTERYLKEQSMLTYRRQKFDKDIEAVRSKFRDESRKDKWQHGHKTALARMDQLFRKHLNQQYIPQKSGDFDSTLFKAENRIANEFLNDMRDDLRKAGSDLHREDARRLKNIMLQPMRYFRKEFMDLRENWSLLFATKRPTFDEFINAQQKLVETIGIEAKRTMFEHGIPVTNAMYSGWSDFDKTDDMTRRIEAARAHWNRGEEYHLEQRVVRNRLADIFSERLMRNFINPHKSDADYRSEVYKLQTSDRLIDILIENPNLFRNARFERKMAVVDGKNRPMYDLVLSMKGQDDTHIRFMVNPDVLNEQEYGAWDVSQVIQVLGDDFQADDVFDVDAQEYRANEFYRAVDDAVERMNASPGIMFRLALQGASSRLENHVARVRHFYNNHPVHQEIYNARQRRREGTAAEPQFFYDYMIDLRDNLREGFDYAGDVEIKMQERRKTFQAMGLKWVMPIQERGSESLNNMPNVQAPAHLFKRHQVEIVSTEDEYDVYGMRAQKGTRHMNTTRPGEDGWLGNPFKTKSAGGEYSRQQATQKFREAFLEKINTDSGFRNEVLKLRGKRIGYNVPYRSNHLQVVQEWLDAQFEDIPPLGVTRAQERQVQPVARLAEQARPPRNMQAKETAKAVVSNKVLAPIARNVSDGSYAKRLGQAARGQNRLVQSARDVEPGDVVYVSIPGKGRGQTERQLQSQINVAISILEAGGRLVTDTRQNAMREHNREGEGRLRSALADRYNEHTEDQYSVWSKTEAVSLEQETRVEQDSVQRSEPVQVQRQKRITRQDLQNNPDTYYLFGDNLLKKGMRGQAAEMRGEPNAIGIPTKRKPATTENAYMTDREYEQNIRNIDKAFSKIPEGAKVVIPEAGLGTGLAQLEKRAPRTFAYLQQKIAELETQVQPGVDRGVVQPAGEISSDATGLNAALTNPTELAKRKGNLQQSYPIEFQGQTYRDSETAYQALKPKERLPQDQFRQETDALMRRILEAKLQQYPRLVAEITRRGGIAWLETATHRIQDKNWGGKGRESRFLSALIDAYEILAPEVQPVDQPSTNVQRIQRAVGNLGSNIKQAIADGRVRIHERWDNNIPDNAQFSLKNKLRDRGITNSLALRFAMMFERQLEARTLNSNEAINEAAQNAYDSMRNVADYENLKTVDSAHRHQLDRDLIEWHHHLLDYPVAFRAIAMREITRPLRKQERDYYALLRPNQEALREAFEEFQNTPERMNFRKLYEKHTNEARKRMLDRLSDEQMERSESGKGLFVYRRRADSSDPAFQRLVNLTKRLSAKNTARSNQWCTSVWAAEGYVQKMDQYFLIDEESGETVLSVMPDKNNSVNWMFGLTERWNEPRMTSIDWLDDTIALLDKYNIHYEGNFKIDLAKKLREQGYDDFNWTSKAIKEAEGRWRDHAMEAHDDMEDMLARQDLDPGILDDRDTFEDEVIRERVSTAAEMDMFFGRIREFRTADVAVAEDARPVTDLTPFRNLIRSMRQGDMDAIRFWHDTIAGTRAGNVYMDNFTIMSEADLDTFEQRYNRFQELKEATIRDPDGRIDWNMAIEFLDVDEADWENILPRDRDTVRFAYENLRDNLGQYAAYDTRIFGLFSPEDYYIGANQHGFFPVLKTRTLQYVRDYIQMEMETDNIEVSSQRLADLLGNKVAVTGMVHHLGQGDEINVENEVGIEAVVANEFDRYRVTFAEDDRSYPVYAGAQRDMQPDDSYNISITRKLVERVPPEEKAEFIAGLSVDIPFSRVDNDILGYADVESGRVGLMADTIASEAERTGLSEQAIAESVLLHEAGVHLGAEGLLGDDFQPVVQRIHELEELGSEIALRARKRRQDIGEESAQETFAYFVEEAVKAEKAGELGTALNRESLALWERIKNKIREIAGGFLEAMGWRANDLTEDQILFVARAAMEREYQLPTKDMEFSTMSQMQREAGPGEADDNINMAEFEDIQIKEEMDVINETAPHQTLFKQAENEGNVNLIQEHAGMVDNYRDTPVNYAGIFDRLIGSQPGEDRRRDFHNFMDNALRAANVTDDNQRMIAASIMAKTLDAVGRRTGIGRQIFDRLRPDMVRQVDPSDIAGGRAAYESQGMTADGIVNATIKIARDDSQGYSDLFHELGHMAFHSMVVGEQLGEGALTNEEVQAMSALRSELGIAQGAKLTDDQGRLITEYAEQVSQWVEEHFFQRPSTQDGPVVHMFKRIRNFMRHVVYDLVNSHVLSERQQQVALNVMGINFGQMLDYETGQARLHELAFDKTTATYLQKQGINTFDDLGAVMNRAFTAEEESISNLQNIPGIGEARAHRIIDFYRGAIFDRGMEMMDELARFAGTSTTESKADQAVREEMMRGFHPEAYQMYALGHSNTQLERMLPIILGYYDKLQYGYNRQRRISERLRDTNLKKILDERGVNKIEEFESVFQRSLRNETVTEELVKQYGITNEQAKKIERSYRWLTRQYPGGKVVQWVRNHFRLMLNTFGVLRQVQYDDPMAGMVRAYMRRVLFDQRREAFEIARRQGEALHYTLDREGDKIKVTERQEGYVKLYMDMLRMADMLQDLQGFDGIHLPAYLYQRNVNEEHNQLARMLERDVDWYTPQRDQKGNIPWTRANYQNTRQAIEEVLFRDGDDSRVMRNLWRRGEQMYKTYTHLLIKKGVLDPNKGGQFYAHWGVSGAVNNRKPDPDPLLNSLRQAIQGHDIQHRQRRGDQYSESYMRERTGVDRMPTLSLTDAMMDYSYNFWRDHLQDQEAWRFLTRFGMTKKEFLDKKAKADMNQAPNPFTEAMPQETRPTGNFMPVNISAAARYMKGMDFRVTTDKEQLNLLRELAGISGDRYDESLGLRPESVTVQQTREAIHRTMQRPRYQRQQDTNLQQILTAMNVRPELVELARTHGEKGLEGHWQDITNTFRQRLRDVEFGRDQKQDAVERMKGIFKDTELGQQWQDMVKGRFSKEGVEAMMRNTGLKDMLESQSVFEVGDDELYLPRGMARELMHDHTLMPHRSIQLLRQMTYKIAELLLFAGGIPFNRNNLTGDTTAVGMVSPRFLYNNMSEHYYRKSAQLLVSHFRSGQAMDDHGQVDPRIKILLSNRTIDPGQLAEMFSITLEDQVHHGNDMDDVTQSLKRVANYYPGTHEARIKQSMMKMIENIARSPSDDTPAARMMNTWNRAGRVVKDAIGLYKYKNNKEGFAKYADNALFHSISNQKGIAIAREANQRLAYALWVHDQMKEGRFDPQVFGGANQNQIETMIMQMGGEREQRREGLEFTPEAFQKMNLAQQLSVAGLVSLDTFGDYHDIGPSEQNIKAFMPFFMWPKINTMRTVRYFRNLRHDYGALRGIMSGSARFAMFWGGVNALRSSLMRIHGMFEEGEDEWSEEDRARMFGMLSGQMGWMPLARVSNWTFSLNLSTAQTEFLNHWGIGRTFEAGKEYLFKEVPPGQQHQHFAHYVASQGVQNFMENIGFGLTPPVKLGYEMGRFAMAQTRPAREQRWRNLQDITFGATGRFGQQMHRNIFHNTGELWRTGGINRKNMIERAMNLPLSMLGFNAFDKWRNDAMEYRHVTLPGQSGAFAAPGDRPVYRHQRDYFDALLYGSEDHIFRAARSLWKVDRRREETPEDAMLRWLRWQSPRKRWELTMRSRDDMRETDIQYLDFYRSLNNYDRHRINMAYQYYFRLLKRAQQVHGLDVRPLLKHENGIWKF